MAYLILDRKLFVISILNLFLAYKIYDYIKASEKKILKIPIAMNTSNEYIYQTLITLTSLAENANKDNIYNIHILIPKNFLIDYRLKILQFELKYKNINIIIIESEEPYVKFENYNSKFSKFFFHLLIPGYDKIIYINYNTLILSDLEELFNINLEENYFSGFLSNDNNTLYNNYNISLNKSINTDVLLINAKKLKEDNKINEFKKIYNKFKDKNLNEKLMINIIFYNDTGILPPKYGMPNFDNVDIGLNYNEKISDICKYEKEEFISSFYEPIIIDLVICKPWEKGKKCKQSDAWWYFAKKNEYFNEIKEKYGTLFE
jgi:lipopolysaccharide biosynthesis glycosyltransferase